MANVRASRSVRRGSAVAVAAAIFASLVFVPDTATYAARPSLGPYRGLATWVDIYDTQLWSDPEATIEAIRVEGVRTLFLETSNYQHRAIVHPLLVGRFIDAAHAAGIDIVAWYLPSFVRPSKDLRKITAAIRYLSPSGQSFDSFALDIESPAVAIVGRRTRRLLDLSAAIRNEVGARYPLGAIVPNPVRLAQPDTYWPGFPYQGLERWYDVFLPMCYSSGDVAGLGRTTRYASRCIELVRAGTGRSTVPIHEIGGIADELDRREVRGFVHAVRSHGILGGSLYDFATTDRRAWAQLVSIPPNPTESPASPIALPYSPALGNVPRADRTHRYEVFFVSGGIVGGAKIVFRAFDIQADEVHLIVNWHDLGTIGTTTAGSWSAPRSVSIAGAILHDSSPNLLAFTYTGPLPPGRWGVRGVAMSPAG
jgi:hypothetical protein